jgi:polar amino acid transport system permease protein
MSDFINNFFNFSFMWQVLPDLLTTGLLNTLILAASAAVLGTVLGLPLAIAGLSKHRWVRYPARVYTDVFRGLPAILTILIIGNGLAVPARPIIGDNPYPLGILALALIASAYIGEIFRAGIQSIHSGQFEAATALGMRYATAMRTVVVPQAVRNVLPSLVNQFIALIKDSSLVYVLGLLSDQRELFRIGQDAVVNTGSQSPLVATGIAYLLLTVPLTHFVNYFDRRLRSGRGWRGKPATA